MAQEVIRAIDFIPEDTFEGPQFFLKKGAEFGYHCHLYRTIGKKDLGLMVTMVGNRVFVEPHRIGKVKKPYSVNKIGEKELLELIHEANDYLSSIPDDVRRKPSKKAMLIGVYQEAPLYKKFPHSPTVPASTI